MSHSVLDIIAERSPHLEWIKDRTLLLSRAGSHSYGTSTPESDEDYRGICIPPKEYYLGSATFQQAEVKEPDITIFEYRKGLSLMMACNPNVLEMLFVDPSDQVFISPLGEELIGNRELFLSKRAKQTFAGYARGQMHRIKLHRRWLLSPVKEPPTRASLGLSEQTLVPQDQLAAATAEINKELDRYSFDWMGELSEPMKISVRSIMAEMLAELKITTEDMWLSAARKVGMSDNFIEVMQKERAYTNKKREYDQYQEWKKNRNPKRAADEAKFGYDGKHAGHLVRLLRCCRELLMTGKLIVKRPDAEELLVIRNGAWSFEQLMEYAEAEDKALQTIYETSTALPKTPDVAAIETMSISMIERSLGYR
jgi:uncharacterized protein